MVKLNSLSKSERWNLFHITAHMRNSLSGSSCLDSLTLSLFLPPPFSSNSARGQIWCSISSHIWETHSWSAAARQSCELKVFLFSITLTAKEDKRVKMSKSTGSWVLLAFLPASPGTNIPLCKHTQLQLFGTVVSSSVGSKENVNANDRTQRFLQCLQFIGFLTAVRQEWRGGNRLLGLRLDLKWEKEKRFYSQMSCIWNLI